jgi:two-component system chemotaxis response regulator CheY
MSRILKNPATVEVLQLAVASAIRELLGTKFDVGELSIQSQPSGMNTIGLIRANHEERTEVIAIGTADDASRASWNHWLSLATPGTSPDDNPGTEKILLHGIGRALLPFLSEAGIISSNSRSLSQLSGKSLCGWGNFAFVSSLRITVRSGNDSASLHLPILDDLEREAASMGAFGLVESSRILLVDDSPVSRSYSRSVLANHGFLSVHECEDGVEAVTELNKPGKKISLVIADWHMPKMNGLQLLQLIRTSDAIATLPVLMVTSEQNKAEIIKAIKQGVSGYLLKPYDHLGLMLAIQKIGQNITEKTRKAG